MWTTIRSWASNLSSQLAHVGGENNLVGLKLAKLGSNTLYLVILDSHISYIALIWYGWKGIKVSQIYEGVGMIVFIRKLSELGSDRPQYSAVSPWRLSIFLSQGNISKPVGPTACAGPYRTDAKCVFLRGEWTIHACSSKDLTVNYKVQTWQFFQEILWLKCCLDLGRFTALWVCDGFCTLRSWICSDFNLKGRLYPTLLAQWRRI